MDITIFPRKLSGTVTAIPSKSMAHRILICAAFSDKVTRILCPETNSDIETTADCLRAIGARITRTETEYIVDPITHAPKNAALYCNESGSTLRFLLPVIGALGIDATLYMSPNLSRRPLAPLCNAMLEMGCRLSYQDEHTLHCTGRLHGGNYRIVGNVSSQFISGLLFAMAIMPGESKLTINGDIQSTPYITMTQSVLQTFGVDSQQYCIADRTYPLQSPGDISVEGDWSNAAFFITAAHLGNRIHITGLNDNSLQGDRTVCDLLAEMNTAAEINAADIPDLVPILSIYAGAACGAKFTNIARLRHKESNRIKSIVHLLSSLGCDTIATENDLIIKPAHYQSCTIDAMNDHRIAMSAAIAATVANGPIKIIGADCVAKSYPSFWDEYRRLGGIYEQHIR